MYRNVAGVLRLLTDVPSIGQGSGGTTTAWADFDRDGVLTFGNGVTAGRAGDCYHSAFNLKIDITYLP